MTERNPETIDPSRGAGRVLFIGRVADPTAK